MKKLIDFAVGELNLIQIIKAGALLFILLKLTEIANLLR